VQGDQRLRLAARAGLAALAVAVVLVAGAVGGRAGVLYLPAYAAAIVPGLPVGRALFGRGHPASLIAGGAVGYGLTSLALWVPVALGAPGWAAFLLSWGGAAAIAWTLLPRRSSPLVQLPPWGRDTTLALILVLLLVPVLVALPYSHIGERDAADNMRYRAYFTADFVWHEALTAELARFSSPPRDPFLARQPLHYYFTYFLLPGVVTGVSRPWLAFGAPIEAFLEVNALCSGMLFLAAIFLATWAALPKAVPAALATALALLASSAEGLWITLLLWIRGSPLSVLRDYNIDAAAYWRFQALSVDGLVRSIWYNPHHSMACARGLGALTIVSRTGASMTPRAAALSGLSLGLALAMSPFPGGLLTLVYAATVLWCAAERWRSAARVVLVQLAAAVPAAIALWWCAANGTFGGAGGSIAFGLSKMASRTGPIPLAFELGPLLLPAGIGLVVAAARRMPLSVRASVLGAGFATAFFYGFSLTSEPIWIGWRAGQVLLVTSPALVALAMDAAAERLPRALTALAVAVLFGVGLPTTIIDVYNAQDTSNVDMGPGFRWTVVLSPADQHALEWIDRDTPQDAVVQMSVGPRGRDTWSLIPSFAHRRMAAGRPISLLHEPAYDLASDEADSMYAAADPEVAWRTARRLKIDYVYVGGVEHDAFSGSADRFDSRPDLFPRVYRRAGVSIYAVWDGAPRRPAS
jgi:hypothetical protein